MLHLTCLVLQKNDLAEHVILPLHRLLQLFQGPFKVIRKRYDKLLDYDSLQGKSKGLRDQEQIKVVSLCDY